jgi:hypothetical protein
MICINIYMWRKVIAITLQAWTGTEGSRKLRLPDFMTMKVERLSALRTGRLYLPENIPHNYVDVDVNM